MAKESFLLYHGYYEPIKDLSFEDKGMLFDAIFQYSIHRNAPSNTSRIYMAFQFFKNQIDQDCKKYDKIVERNQKNGKKGGRPETEESPKNPLGLLGAKKADTVTVTVTDTVTDTDNELNIQFDKFWDLYGKKVDARKCKQKFVRLSKSDIEKIFETLPAYIKTTPDLQYRKNPATYLNNRSWENIIPQKIEQPRKHVQ